MLVCAVALFFIYITKETHLQCEDSKVRKNTLVLFVLIIVSSQDDHVPKAVLKAAEVDIPSFSEPPTWK